MRNGGCRHSVLYQDSIIGIGKLALIIVQLLFLVEAGAQQLNFHRLNDGPSSECYSIIQDRKGYIWISTEKGIYRYDGNTFRSYDKDIFGKPVSSTFHLTEDSQGRIVFNVLSGGIYYISGDSVFPAPFCEMLEDTLKHGRFQILDIYEGADHHL